MTVEERQNGGSIAGLDGGGWGAVAQAREGPLDDGKSQEMDAPLDPPGRNTALPTPLSQPHETPSSTSMARGEPEWGW